MVFQEMFKQLIILINIKNKCKTMKEYNKEKEKESEQDYNWFNEQSI